MAGSNITDAMRAVVGQEFGRTVSFPVSASDIRKWALAVYFPEPPPAVFWDERAAESGVSGGLIAPEDFNPFAWMTSEGPRSQDGDDNDPDRIEKLVGIEGPGLKFQLNGGMRVEYGVPIRPDDVITSVSNVAAYTEREGRLGLMLFTTIEDLWTNQHDQLVRTRQLTLIRY